MNYNWSDYTVLIVDDEPMIIDFFREVLSLTKINMLFVDNGNKAINIIKQHNDIDIVLLDIRMPEINGFEVFKKIKELRPKLPVIAQTAYAFSDDIEMVKSAGFDDYICKPISNDLLCQKIEAMLKK